MAINELNIGNKLQPTRKVWTHENNIAHGSDCNFDKKAHILSYGGHVNSKTKYNYINKEPLKDNFGTNVTFKGFSVSNLKKEFLSTKPIYDRAFQEGAKTKLSDCLEIIHKIDPDHLDEFAGYIKAFAVELVKDKEKFHKPMPKKCREKLEQLANHDALKDSNSLKELVAKAVNGDKNAKETINIIGESLADLPRKTKLKRTCDTFTDLFVDPVKKLFGGKPPHDDFKEVNDNYSRFMGVIDAIKDLKEDKLKDLEIISIIRNDFSKRLADTKANFKTASANFGNRLVSGSITAAYLAIDQYNGTRLLNDDPNISKKERNTRLRQEMFRVVLTGYMTYGVMEVFKESCNKSMKFALFSSMAVVGFCEAIGRTLVGKPIYPVSKEKAKQLNIEEQKPKNGLAAMLGGLLSKSAAKAAETKAVNTTKTKESVPAANLNIIPAQSSATKPNMNNWLDNKTENSSQVSFSGGMSNIGKFAKKVFIDDKPMIPREFNVDEVRKALGKLKEAYKEQAEFCESTINTHLGIGDLNSLDKDAKISIGKQEDKTAALVKSFIVPLIWVKNFFKNIPANLRKIGEFLHIVKKAPAKNIDLNKKNVETTGNIIEFVIKNKGLSIKDLKCKLKNGFGANVSKKQHYDQTTYSLYNMNIARGITSAFLISDAYNLTMQYSDGDEKLSGKRGTQRLFQEISRILFSAYILNMTNNIFTKQINKSIYGTLGVTALNVILNENISRTAVGQPVIPKTKAQLEEIQNNNHSSRNPVLRFIAKATGRKNTLVKPQTDNQVNIAQTQANTQIPIPANTTVFTQFIQKP
ncbi:MAG: hypothetical protein PHC34_13045 [Candidatus Gastranaerophilales bacterium]|nr:hypothetical protein [Candidatus Gastranaerophilales bacterium]